MLFGTAPRLAREKSFNICIDGKQIERVHEFTYLGVVFDERLSWGSHVKKMISKAGKRVGMLGPLCDNLTTNSANVVYISLIRPILEYCDTPYSYIPSWKCALDKYSDSEWLIFSHLVGPSTTTQVPFLHLPSLTTPLQSISQMLLTPSSQLKFHMGLPLDHFSTTLSRRHSKHHSCKLSPKLTVSVKSSWI